MASMGPIKVEAQVNHVMHSSGAIEAGAMNDQVVDRERVSKLIELIDRACAEAGFSRQSTEVIESFNFKRGHMPEMHLVLVQLPDYLSSQLQEVVRKREDLEWQNLGRRDDGHD